MRLLSRGVGIKAIGDLLGHRSLEATCVYLRIDANMLRTVALPVPLIVSMQVSVINEIDGLMFKLRDGAMRHQEA